MTDPVEISADEFGIVRVFHLSSTLAAELAGNDDIAPLAKALGVPSLAADHVQISSLADLAPLRLSGLLEQGHGIAPATLAPVKSDLDRLDGTAAIVASRAFGTDAETLHPTPDARLVATLSEEGAAPPPLEPPRSDSARRETVDTDPPEHPGYRTSRRTLLIGLLAAVALGLLVLFLTRGGG